MGANMARRLKDCGHPLAAVLDADREAAVAVAAELGCAAVESLVLLAAAAEVILTVVTDDEAMRRLFLAADDSLLQHAQGKLFINCATVSPVVQVEIAAAARAAGALVVEACMASSIPQARNGSLNLMLGGSAEAIAAAAEILDDLAQTLLELAFHAGPGLQ